MPSQIGDYLGDQAAIVGKRSPKEPVHGGPIKDKLRTVSDFEDQSWVKMGVAGALEKEYLRDQGFFIEMLAKALQTTVPDDVSLKTKGFIKKSVVGVQLSLGDSRYSFEKPDHGPVFALKTKVVRGIALKSDEIDVALALKEVGEALEQRAAKSGQTRNALASALGLE